MALEITHPGVLLCFLATLVSTASVLGVWSKLKIFSGTPAGEKLQKLPGPVGLPWAGPVWCVDAARIWLTFAAWAKKYGDFYQVTLFGIKFLIVSHPDIAKEILAKQGQVCSDRPTIGCVPNSKIHGKYMPFLGHNDVLRRQRKFGVFVNSKAFRAQYHGHIATEVNRMVYKLHTRADFYDVLFEQCFARISCKLTWGVPEPAASVAYNAHSLMRNLSPGGRKTNVLKFLSHLPTWMSSEKSGERFRSEDEMRLWGGLFEHAKQQHADGKLPPCFARDYLEDPSRCEMDDDEAVFAVAIMATVSILTLMAPIGWFVIAMAMYPEAQAAVQAEIDAVCGDRMPEFSDMPNMPMARAAIVETLRWHSTVPTGIPHVVERDIKWNGYNIPAGTNVMACDWNMCRQESIYPSPEVFNPMRWLDESYPTYRTPLNIHPSIQGQHTFGFGRRSCIGQDHAAAVLFSSCTAILWAFEIKGKGVLKRETATPNVLPLPQAQNLQFVTRECKRSRVEAMR